MPFTFQARQRTRQLFCGANAESPALAELQFGIVMYFSGCGGAQPPSIAEAVLLGVTVSFPMGWHEGREVAEPSQTELGRFQKSGVACLQLKLAQSLALLIRQVFLQHQLQARRYKIVGLAADGRNQDIEGFPRFDTRVLVDHRIDCTVQK